MVYAEKILVDHIRLFGRSENDVKMGFLGKWCKKLIKKNCLCFTIILECGKPLACCVPLVCLNRFQVTR